MSKIKFTINVFALLILSLAVTAVAEALPLRTFVSSTGINTNACSQAQPCRTFAGALTKTEPGGEITALDSGEYGVVAITKGITLQAVPGVYAVLTPAVDKVAVAIRVGQADDVVLRGLTIAGGKQARRGVLVNTVNSLHIENCVIHGFTSGGIAFLNDSAANRLFVKDTIIRGNGGPSLHFQPVAGKLLVTIDNSRLEDSGVGLLSIGGGTVIAMRDTIVAGNRSSGLAIEGDSELNIDNCMVSNNGTIGVDVRNGALARVSNSTVTNNVVAGLSNNGFAPGTLETRGNNTVRGNDKDISGTVTAISGK